MNIIIETIPHDKQRYSTVGDWQIDHEKDTILIRISETGNWRCDMLVAFHELAEALLCMDRGISQDIVDRFDIAYEEKRKQGDESEPGDNPHAPYRKEHFFATTIERMLSAEFNIDWQYYESLLHALG